MWINQAHPSSELDDVRHLVMAIIDWRTDRHGNDLELIRKFFDNASFEAELPGFTGKFVPPNSRVKLQVRSKALRLQHLFEADRRTNARIFLSIALAQRHPSEMLLI